MAGEKKTRINCNVEDLQTKAVDSLTRMLELMKEAGVDEECLSNIRNSISSDTSNWLKTLRIVEGIIFSMPYIDHARLSLLLLKTWEYVDGIVCHTRQNYFRKVNAARSNKKKKIDPKILEKLENECFRADHNQTLATMEVIRMRQISQVFATSIPKVVAN